MDSNAELLSIEEAAVLLGCSVDTVRRNVRAGLLKRALDARGVRFHMADVVRLRAMRALDSRSLNELTDAEIVEAYKARRARRDALKRQRMRQAEIRKLNALLTVNEAAG